MLSKAEMHKLLEGVIQYRNHPHFRRVTFQREAESLVLPTLPITLHYEPTERHRAVTVHVMNREEEARWFLHFNYARKMLAKLQTRAHCPCAASFHERSEFFRQVNRWHSQVKYLQEYLTRTNMPLLYSMIARSRRYIAITDWEEAVSEGQIFLMRAINGFDVKRGVKFSTYACQIILNGLRSMMAKRLRRQNRFRTVELPDNFGNGVDDPTLIEDDKGNLEALERALATTLLTEVEQLVIRRRFGLSGMEAQTLLQIGEELGVSKERVRQIQAKALAKLRTALLSAS